MTRNRNSTKLDAGATEAPWESNFTMIIIPYAIASSE